MSSRDCVRETDEKDWMFLTEASYPYASMLSDLLTQDGVPFVAKDRMGAGMALKVGPLLERTCFYVPGTHYERAAGLLKNFS